MTAPRRLDPGPQTIDRDTATSVSREGATMPTASPSTSASPARRKARSSEPDQPDAIELLTEDHEAVKKLFRRFGKLHKAGASAEEREALAAEICAMLTVHAQIEEEIFYPAVREALPDTDLVDEADVEHASAKDLIAQIESMSGDDELYDAKVTVLGEFIDHHVEEEQEQMFKKVRRKLDLREIGAALHARKQELM
jgi:hypothetical protein